MSDLSTVRDTLVSMVLGVLYPGGDPTGEGTQSTLGVPADVFAGWPLEATLTKTLNEGKVTVTVFPGNWSNNTTRYGQEWHQGAPVAPNTTVEVSGQSVVFGGVPTAGEVVGVIAKPPGGRFPIWFPYTVLAGDTLAGVCAGVAARIALDGRVAAQANVATLTVTNGTLDSAVVVAPQPMWRELRRQEHRFQVSIWAPTPELRDAAGALIDLAFAKVDFLDLGEPIGARFRYYGTSDSDNASNERVYRRDLFYNVEYPTIEYSNVMPLVALGELLVANGAAPAAGVQLGTALGAQQQ